MLSFKIVTGDSGRQGVTHFPFLLARALALTGLAGAKFGEGGAVFALGVPAREGSCAC
jgi:hypothetical protein